MSHEVKGPDNQGPLPPSERLLSLLATGMVGTGSSEVASTSETHISVVIFLGDRAYKVKKPLDLGFLDFRTREVREAVCKREVELNSRLAPDVYLGVVDLVGADGMPFDHLVVMRRMPGELRLSTLVRSGEDVGPALHAIAEQLAEFHSRADISDEIAQFGTPAAMRKNWEANTEQLRDLSRPASDRQGALGTGTIDEIALLAQRYLAGRTSLFSKRIDEERVRDCHGDVLSDDIFCLPDGPRILDCIEFDDRLRYGDVLGDVAFLAMDLERLGRPELGQHLMEQYEKLSGDSFPLSLANFWIAYRAQVRAKVALLRGNQGDRDSYTEAERLLEISLTHLRQCQIRLVLIGGAPGTGKSTLAKALAAHKGWVLIRSDEVRKELLGMAPTDRSGASLDVGMGIYDPATTEATYEAMLSRAADQLGLGNSVILDATWNDAVLRSRAQLLATSTSSELIELCCEVPQAVAMQRVERRAAQGEDASDVSAAIAQALQARSPWPTATVVDTSGSVEESLTLLVGAIDPQGLDSK